MARDTATRGTRAAGALRLGERLRQLRIAAGLTQTELVGERFSKEYVSQIERGKTRPTAETIEWIAGRLGVDPSFLVNGVSADERGRVEALLARAEAQIEAGQETEALAELESLKPSALGVGLPEVEFRHLLAESRARTRLGQIRAAIELLTRARVLSEHSIFSDVERADVLCRLGICRYRLSSISTALALLNEALALAEGSGLPCDLLRSQILDWRSRCYRRQRDFE